VARKPATTNPKTPRRDIIESSTVPDAIPEPGEATHRVRQCKRRESAGSPHDHLEANSWRLSLVSLV